MVYIGVDACKAEWFAVMLTEEGNWRVNIFPNISNLWNQSKDARLILIDIPIGLREDDFNERICDQEARKLLGPKRGSSVFPVTVLIV
jgi:predicted RNase H-like nuclease